jgi:hypothetical protein
LGGALSETLGRRVEVALEAPGGPPEEGEAGERITPGAVREGRLRELLEREPLLGRAVEELDLEMLE